ncbi:MAG: cytochrome c3 family protein [Woeseiaceae bacterium]|nr:cytochrome c3 family protein [Woeseiaceae bacterium]
MKYFLLATLAAAVSVMLFGSPIAREKPLRDHYYESPEPILPMSFAHEDHVSENCILCHHNYVDDTGGGPCMNCHTTNQDVWPLFEQQYHELCRGCHEEKAALGIDGGPPRQCIECHRGDDLP